MPKIKNTLPVAKEKIPPHKGKDAERYYRNKIFEFLAGLPLDADLPVCPTHIARAMGIDPRTVKKWLDMDLWQEVLEFRRKRIAEALVKVDAALFRKAMKGSIDAIKLVYERHEGWTRKLGLEINKNVTVDISDKLWAMKDQEIARYLQTGQIDTDLVIDTKEVKELPAEENES